MRKLVLAAALLAGCGGDPSSDRGGDPSSDRTDTTTQATQAAQAAQARPIKLSTDATGLQATAGAKGVAVQLDERYQHAVVARRNPDGTISTECHDDGGTAQAFMQGTAPRPTPTQLEVK